MTAIPDVKRVKPVKVMSFNCCSLNSFQAELVRDSRFKAGLGLGGFLLANEIDLLALQEHKFNGDEHRSKDHRVAAAFRQLACIPGYESAWSFCTRKKGYAGTAIWMADSLGPALAVDTAPIRGTANQWYSGEIAGADGGPDRSGALPISEADDEDFSTSGRAVLVDLGSWAVLNVYVPHAGYIGEARARERIREAARATASAGAGASAGGAVLAAEDVDGAEEVAGGDPAAADDDGTAASASGSSAVAPAKPASGRVAIDRSALYAVDTKPRLRVALAFLRAVRAKGKLFLPSSFPWHCLCFG